MSVHKKIADELVDGFLDRTPLAEPDEMLTHRVMARLRAQDSETVRAWPGWRWAAVAACAMVLLAAVWMLRPGAIERPKDVAVIPSKVAAPTVKAAIGPERVRVAVPANDVRSAKQWSRPTSANSGNAIVKQAMFPSASPLSEQERMALIYIRRTPKVEVMANAKPEPEKEWLINQWKPEASLGPQASQNTK